MSRILPVSARSRAALALTRADLADRLRAGDLALDDVVVTLATGREQFPHRYAVVAGTVAEAAAALDPGRTPPATAVTGVAGPVAGPSVPDPALAAALAAWGVAAVAGPTEVAVERGFPGTSAATTVVVDDPDVPAADRLAVAVADLWTQGVAVDLAAGGPGRRVHLTPGRFDRGGQPESADGLLAAATAALAGAAGPGHVRQRLRRATGARLPSGDLPADPAALADLAAAALSGGGPAVAGRPLAPVQQRWLFHDLVRPPVPEESNLTALGELPAGTAEDDLRRALAALQHRHPELRTRFVRSGDRWTAVEGPAVPLSVHRPGGDLAELARRPFDLVDASLARAEVAGGVVALTVHRTVGGDVRRLLQEWLAGLPTSIPTMSEDLHEQ